MHASNPQDLPVVSPGEQELVDTCVAAADKLRALRSSPDEARAVLSAIVGQGTCVVAVLSLPADHPDPDHLSRIFKQMLLNAVDMGVSITGGYGTAQITERRTLPPQ